MTTAMDIAKKAIDLADQKPHFVYEAPDGGDCLYVHEGVGSCLYGQVLLELGVVDADYLAEQGDRIRELLFRLGDEGKIEHPASGSATLLAEMQFSQIQQDNNHEWGDAVATLREFLGRTGAAA